MARAAGSSHGDAVPSRRRCGCGGTMTIAISLAVLNSDLITTRTHAALMLSGLVTTVLAGPLLHRGRPDPRLH
jgi:hypothetical protein